MSFLFNWGERERCREREREREGMMMSEWIVGKWNQKEEEEDEAGEERNRSSHVQSDLNLSSVVPMCNNNEAVRELTWENGQISLHGLLPPPNNSQTKQTYHGLDHNCTLESIVHQATSFPSSSSAQWREISDMQVDPNFGINDPSAAENMMVKVKTKESMNMNRSKRERNISDHHDNSIQQCGRSNYVGVEESACGSASATFCRDHTDTIMMTWPSLESPRSLKCARLTNDHDHDSLYHDCSENHDGEGTTKGESFRSQSSARRSRAAAIHNQSERRRRDRINEKMKTLQKLVPNASKTDKASMLDEVIEYLKQLQAQVQMMSSSARNMPQMMMPMGMQQLQMSMLARMGMGMGMGMGMVDGTGLGRNMPHSFPPLLHAPAPTPPFVPQPFPMPPMVPATAPLKPNFDATPSTLPNFNDAYVNTFLAQQSMNMEFLNKMSALYRQQSSQQPSKKPVSLSLPNDGRGHHGQ